MADDHAMYITLFHAITDAVKILQDAQLKTETMYIEHEPEITFLPSADSALKSEDEMM